MNASVFLLEMRRCSLRFGGLAALSELDLRIAPGELLGLIGPNGAGKTTIFNLITGVYQPTAGDILFESRSLLRLRPYQITSRGIARTFQNIRLFPSMSVFDNVRAAFHLHGTTGFAHALTRGAVFRKEEDRVRMETIELLKLMNLERWQDAPAKTLPYGEQRRLEIVRALATGPRLLLLDEPAAGMNPTEKAALIDLIGFIHAKYQVAVLLVEHDMQVVMKTCPRILVLDHGVKIAEGTAAEVRANPAVIEAYLGQEPAREKV